MKVISKGLQLDPKKCNAPTQNSKEQADSACKVQVPSNSLVKGF